MGVTVGRFTCEFGLLYRKQVRQFLEKRIFEGDDIEYLEQKGFTGSVFIIKGDEVAVESVKLKLVAWVRRS